PPVVLAQPPSQLTAASLPRLSWQTPPITVRPSRAGSHQPWLVPVPMLYDRPLAHSTVIRARFLPTGVPTFFPPASRMPSPGGCTVSAAAVENAGSRDCGEPAGPITSAATPRLATVASRTRRRVESVRGHLASGESLIMVRTSPVE